MRTANSILSSLTVFLLITASVSVVSANTLCVSQEIGADNYTNYTSIQEALEHARNGDKILVYPGNYTENVVVNLTDLCILSASGKAEDTIVHAEDANESVFYVSADGVKIGGLTIQGSDRAGIELYSSDRHVILNNMIKGNYAGIAMNSSSESTIYRNTLEENFGGIGMMDSDDSMVAENVLKTNGIATILSSGENNEFSKNTLSNNSLGFMLLFSRHNIFSRNTITNTSVGFMLEESENNNFTENTVNFPQNAVIVDSSSDNCFSRNTFKGAYGVFNESEYENVSEIFSKVSDNPLLNELENENVSEIFAKVSENPLLNELENENISETFTGDSENSLLDALDSENIIKGREDYSGFAVLVGASERNLFSENTFKNNTAGCLLIDAEDNEFTDNKFKNNTLGCLLIQAENNEFTDNCLEESSVGVVLFLTGNNSFSGNTFTNTKFGFMLQKAENNELIENTVDISGVALWMSSGRSNKISENTFTNTGCGFILQEAENNELIGNTVDIGGTALFRGPKLFGGNELFMEPELFDGTALLIMLGRDNKISGNTFTNAMAGMVLAEIENNEFSENTISDGSYAMFILGADNNTISGNEFSNNNLAGVLAIDTNKSIFLNNNISTTFSNSVPKNPSNCFSSCYSNESALIEQNKLFEEIGLLKQSELLKEGGFSANNSFLAQRALLGSDQMLVDGEPFEGDPIFGIIIADANNSVMEGNRVSDYYFGVLLLGVENSTLSGNWLENNGFGLTLENSSESLVYNNYFNNTNNANTAFEIENLVETLMQEPENDPTCIWNISKTECENIVGGPYLGGNYWALPDGTGFSQTHQDADEDGICDLQYNITEDGLNIDFLPLTKVPEKEDNCGGNEEERYTSEGSSGGSSQKYLPDSSANEEHSDSSQKKVTAGTEIRFTFREPKNDISKVSFKSKKYSGIVGIRIEEADVNETESLTENDSKAYRYVEILVGNEAFEGSDNIANGNIEFRVPKNWMVENGINPETITLNRLEDKDWKQLATEISEKDKDYYYFQAKTPGFSCFAITGKQNAASSFSEQKAENSEEIPINEAAQEQTDAEEKEKAPGFGLLLSGTGGLLARSCLKRR
ncbi:MAG: NosD domain-containing protein [Methanosarcina sp.]